MKQTNLCLPKVNYDQQTAKKDVQEPSAIAIAKATPTSIKAFASAESPKNEESKNDFINKFMELEKATGQDQKDTKANKKHYDKGEKDDKKAKKTGLKEILKNIENLLKEIIQKLGGQDNKSQNIQESKEKPHTSNQLPQNNIGQQQNTNTFPNNHKPQPPQVLFSPVTQNQQAQDTEQNNTQPTATAIAKAEGNGEAKASASTLNYNTFSGDLTFTNATSWAKSNATDLNKTEENKTTTEKSFELPKNNIIINF